MRRCMDAWMRRKINNFPCSYASTPQRILSSFFIFYFLCLPVLALEFDTSLDDSIRKNYNPSKIEEDMALPALPKILNETKSSSVKPVSQVQKQAAIQTQAIKTQPMTQTLEHIQSVSKIPEEKSYVTLKQGTRIRVKLLNSISDRSKKGTKVTFVSRYPVSTTYFTIPMGSVFKGEIIDSHKPQLSGNGGLIAIRISSITLADGIHPIDAYVTKVNFKNIYFNNIKGKRKYISSMFHSMKPGRSFLNKMWHTSGNLAQDGSTVILIPFALAVGGTAFAGNVLASPAIALFYKGDSIYIKEGSDFEIKLSQDVFIYN